MQFISSTSLQSVISSMQLVNLNYLRTFASGGPLASGKFTFIRYYLRTSSWYMYVIWRCIVDDGCDHNESWIWRFHTIKLYIKNYHIDPIFIRQAFQLCFFCPNLCFLLAILCSPTLPVRAFWYLDGPDWTSIATAVAYSS